MAKLNKKINGIVSLSTIGMSGQLQNFIHKSLLEFESEQDSYGDKKVVGIANVMYNTTSHDFLFDIRLRSKDGSEKLYKGAYTSHRALELNMEKDEYKNFIFSRR